MPFVLPASIARSPIGFRWEPDQYDFGHGFTSDGSRSAIVQKLLLMSVRGTLGLLAASAEWLTHRLADPADPLPFDLVAALWAGAVDPRPVDLAMLPYAEHMIDPSKGPILTYARTVRSCYETALCFDGAFLSYAETALRLVDYVMPNRAYRHWRRDCFGHLATLTSSHSMPAVRASLDEAAIARKLSDGDFDEIWGPALPRDAYDPRKRADSHRPG
ncbi:hypothetical protein JCM9534A_63860 [Catenuloplanes indicus JCM 9534]